MKELIGKSKVTSVLPLLKMVADENNLKLSRSKDFKQARIILENRYKINRIS
jgi:hypothetical protein